MNMMLAVLLVVSMCAVPGCNLESPLCLNNMHAYHPVPARDPVDSADNLPGLLLLLHLSCSLPYCSQAIPCYCH